ncbi:hypothetical protein ZOSMA_8G01100 [Zostera marina]|uniref:Tetratricopeptide repeat (TPR)-like superfamily protein n=1 Tax=Zostera marina TaxID=29655 RepID=A0A0K9NJL8_ZOSMR|nr:hypothetical protein ZOSMA_8G01100 [Zostera marina]
MDTVIAGNICSILPSLIRPSIFHPNPCQRIFFCSSQSKPRRRYKYPIFCTFYSTSSSSVNLDSTAYGGWEELDPLNESVDVDSIRRFLASLTTRDGKNAFFFGLGFLSALAISRNRVCTMSILPVSIFVFLAGLSIGVAQSDMLVRLLGDRGENKSVGIIQIDSKSLLGFMDYLDGQMSELKLCFQKFINSDSFDKSEIERILDVIETVRLAASPVKKSIKDHSIDRVDTRNRSPWVDMEKSTRMSSSKSSKRTSKDIINMVGFDFIRYIGALFYHEKLKSTTKSKENPNRVLQEIPLDKMEESKMNKSIHTKESKAKISNLDSSKEVDDDHPEKLASLHEISQIPLRYSSKINDNREDDLFTFEEEDSNLNRRFDNTRKKQKSGKPRNNLHENDSSKVSTEESTSTVEIYNRMREPNETSIVNDCKIISDDDLQPMTNVDAEKMTPASMDSDLDIFTQNVHDGAQLLKRAREYLRSEVDEEMAEVVLYKSAELLSSAVALKPMSLLAVGQLGNTLLLHGQLKLKISRDMRSFLSRNNGQRPNFSRSSNSFVTKEDVPSSDFISACEECEELLLEAGRNYRIALSIDGSDTRSLYNWGIALYFRAELIADVGPEAALEADQVYLAAIDKFDATTSRNNGYAVDALYRWGLALRRRSNLRLGNGRDKIKLLKQAKSLFEEVVSVDSNNELAREALFSCLSEMKYKA